MLPKIIAQKILPHHHSARLEAFYEAHRKDLGPNEVWQLGTGTRADFSKFSLGIVGSRKASPYGLRFTRELVGEIVQRGLDWNIVSGGAYGVDIEAHESALRGGLGTQAWLVGPLSSLSPRAHWESFRAIACAPRSSLFVPLGVDPEARGFDVSGRDWVLRNFWLASACDAVVAVEANVKSGTWHTVRFADRLGIPVFALPGAVFEPQSRGTNQMISTGYAHPITSVGLLVEQLVVERNSLPYNNR